MRTPNRWTMIIGTGLVYAVPTLVGLLIWLIHPEWPNFGFPVFGAIYGLPVAGLVIYLWINALRKAENESQELRLEIGAAVFVVVTIATAFFAEREELSFYDSSSTPEVSTQTDAGRAISVETPMSESERKLHVRAVLSVKEGAASWMKQLIESDAHGPAGSMPSFVAIEPSSVGLRVFNRGDGRIRVALARVTTAADDPAGGYCPYRSARGPEFYEVEPDESEVFLPGPSCTAQVGDIELRIGDPVFQDAVGWWSDSAIARWQRANPPELVER